MRVPDAPLARIAAFAVALGLAVGAGAAVGAAVGPIGEAPVPMDAHTADADDAGHG